MIKFANAISKSISANTLPEHKYIQLSTVYENRPRCRTVVFRGFKSNNILIFTDKNSNKVKELRLNPNSEICWYFPVTREQYRIRGLLSISNDSELILSSWKSLSQNAKKGFERNKLPLDEVVADSFCVLIFESEYAEVLDLYNVNSDPKVLSL